MTEAAITLREDLLRRAMAAWSRGDLEGAIEMFHPEVVWHMSGILPDSAGTVRGRDGVREFWSSFTEPWDRIEVEPVEFHHAGEWTVVGLRFCAVGRADMRVEISQAHALRFEDGLVIEYRSFRELDDALAAAGAS